MQKLNTYEATPWVVGYQCCIVIYSFISFGLILVSVFSQSKLMDSAPQMYSDWDQPMILDLQVLDACPIGYSNILNFTWPGTAMGCDCTHSNGTDPLSYSKYYYMECSEFMLSENCQPLKPLSSTQFTLWPVEQKGYMMCAKLSNYTAMEAFSLEPQSGYKKCGNIWQVPTTDECPITSFTIGTTGTPIGTTGAYYQIARLQGDAVPLASFTIGYNSICYDIAQVYEFQYLDNLIHYECFTEDSRYQRITNDAQYTDLLKVNGQWDAYGNLYGNTNILSRNVNLFSRQFTQFYYNTSQLCQQEDLQFIHDLNWYIKDSVMDVQLAAQVVVGIQAGVFGFLIPLISAISLVGCEFKYTQLNRKSSHYKDLFSFWLGVKMISEILCTIMLASDMGYQNIMMKHFSDYINANCSDTLTLADMSTFYNNYEIYVYNYVLLNFILCIITNVLDLFVTYIMCRDKHRQGILVQVEERTHPKNYTSTHPDELLNKTKVQPASSIKKHLSDREIPDDDVAKNVPDD